MFQWLDKLLMNTGQGSLLNVSLQDCFSTRIIELHWLWLTTGYSLYPQHVKIIKRLTCNYHRLQHVLRQLSEITRIMNKRCEWICKVPKYDTQDITRRQKGHNESGQCRGEGVTKPASELSIYILAPFNGKQFSLFWLTLKNDQFIISVCIFLINFIDNQSVFLLKLVSFAELS